MSAEENVKIRKKNRWTQAMLEHLIKVWGKYYHELKMNSRGHDKIYAKIIEELAMVGCTASMDDVRGRIHNLSGKYRKEAAAEVATGRRSQWPYFYKIGRFFDYTVPAPVPTNARPVLYDMSQYLALEYAMEDSLDLEGNERILIQDGELSDEEHLEDGLDEEEDRSEADGWQSEHLEDYDDMEEDLAEEAEEGPLVEVLPGEDGASIAPLEPEKDPSEPEDGPLVPNNGPSVPNNGPSVPNNGPLVPNKDEKVETPPAEGRPSPRRQQPVTQKEKEKSVHTQDSDGK
uniref:Myb/SANT-like DNA-binding domain-containing protein n=1 Tax=Anopheles atroparvus TaxID=41427 RepID=A0A182JBC4_ANOAO